MIEQLERSPAYNREKRIVENLRKGYVPPTSRQDPTGRNNGDDTLIVF